MAVYTGGYPGTLDYISSLERFTYLTFQDSMALMKHVVENTSETG